MTWSVQKKEKSLLSSLQKKAKVIGTLAKKFNLRIVVHNKSGRKKKERRDNVYVRMDGGEREYKKKQNLHWKLRDLLEIINGSKIITNENFPSFTEAFDHETSIRQMYNFLKMQKEVS